MTRAAPARGAPFGRPERVDADARTWQQTVAILGTLMSFSGVVTVAPDGAMADAIAVDRPAGESNHRWPWVLPDGKHFVYVVRSSNP